MTDSTECELDPLATLSDEEEAEGRAWEKTVEYRFLLEAVSDGKLQFVAPFDGDAERAGDGIFSCNSLITLIEFKRRLRDFASERKKFGNWRGACLELAHQNHCHYFVFGDDRFSELKAAKFFPKFKPGNKEAWTFLNDFKSVLGLGGGVPPDDFIKYLDLLMQHKRRSGEGGSSAAGASAGSHVHSVAIAFGLNTETNELVAIRVEDYLDRLKPGIKDAVRQAMADFRNRQKPAPGSHQSASGASLGTEEPDQPPTARSPSFKRPKR
jgi:hypothetical protein